MKTRIESYLTLCLLFVMFIIMSCFVKNKEEKPNILFIAIDDLRPELACYGAKK